MKTKLLLVFILSFYWIIPANALSPDMWKSYNKTSNINDIQEQNGFLWIASNAGVVKFDLSDGSYVNFNNTNSELINDNVSSVFIDNQGKKWFCTFYGISMFDGITWNTFDESNMGQNVGWVHDATQDANGNMWFGTQSGFLKYDGTTWTLYNPASDTAIKSYDITCVGTDSKGNVWGASRDDGYQRGGLFMFDGKKWIGYTMHNSAIPDYYFNDLVIDSKDNIWLASGDHGLIKYDGTTWTAYTQGSSFIGDIKLNHLSVDHNGNIWMAMEKYLPNTGKGGISMFDGTTFVNYNKSNDGFPTDNATYAFATNDGRIFGGAELSGLFERTANGWEKRDVSVCGIHFNDVSTVFVDSKNNKWFGSGSLGIDEYTDGQWIHYDTTNSLLPDNRITSFAEDAEGNIWVGTWNGAIKISGKTMTVYNTENTPNIYSNSVNDIEVVGNDVYLATGNGYSVFDGNNWSIHYRGNMTDFPSSVVIGVSAIAIDDSGTVWMGLNGYGVISYNGTSCTGYTPSNSGLKDAAITDVAIDTANTLWVGTDGHGLYHFDGKNWTNYRVNNTACDWIHAVTFDSLGNLWTGGVQWGKLPLSGGFSIYKNGTWQSFRREDSKLPYFNVTGIAFDHKGNAWIAMAGYGVVVYNPGGVVVDAIPTVQENSASSLTLGQNFPNPFNTRTTIGYHLSAKSMVDLSVYNILGQKVRVLIHGLQNQGKHTVRFNAEKMPNGIYYYQISTENNRKSRKMLLKR